MIRWRLEHLHLLRVRNKWNSATNLIIVTLVVVTVEVPLVCWPFGLMTAWSYYRYRRLAAWLPYRSHYWPLGLHPAIMFIVAAWLPYRSHYWPLGLHTAIIMAAWPSHRSHYWPLGLHTAIIMAAWSSYRYHYGRLAFIPLSL